MPDMQKGDDSSAEAHFDRNGSLMSGILPSTMCCEEKSHLLNLYKAAMVRYSISIEDLNRTRGRTSTEEYDRLRSLSKDAWSSAEGARLALEGHTGTHKC
jgi:hypothetical protein